MVFKDVCVLVLWTKVASALEGLKGAHIPTLMTHCLFSPPPFYRHGHGWHSSLSRYMYVCCLVSLLQSVGSMLCVLWRHEELTGGCWFVEGFDMAMISESCVYVFLVKVICMLYCPKSAWGLSTVTVCVCLSLNQVSICLFMHSTYSGIKKGLK